MTTSKILFVREYPGKYSGGKVYDVLYKTNRLFTYFPEELPKTIIKFIKEAKIHKEQPIYEYKYFNDVDKYRKIIIGTEIIHRYE